MPWEEPRIGQGPGACGRRASHSGAHATLLKQPGWTADEDPTGSTARPRIGPVGNWRIPCPRERPSPEGTPMPDRRQFLQFLAGSPFLAAAGLSPRLLQDLTSPSTRRAAQALSRAQQALQDPAIIRSAADAL